jgi:hypothetical protein
LFFFFIPPTSARQLLGVRAELKGAVMSSETRQTSRGREYLMDFERSEEIYLVTRDRDARWLKYNQHRK